MSAFLCGIFLMSFIDTAFNGERGAGRAVWMLLAFTAATYFGIAWYGAAR